MCKTPSHISSKRSAPVCLRRRNTSGSATGITTFMLVALLSGDATTRAATAARRRGAHRRTGGAASFAGGAPRGRLPLGDAIPAVLAHLQARRPAVRSQLERRQLARRAEAIARFDPEGVRRDGHESLHALRRVRVEGR